MPLQSLKEMGDMDYISTRGNAPKLNFTQAMMTGLAHDGGLYVPQDVVQFSANEIAALAGVSYEETTFRVMRPFIGDAFSDDEFHGLIEKAYANYAHLVRAPIAQIGNNHFLLELFHGPTLAFKDFAMQLIGQMMQAVLSRSGQRITIVGATSGDTGSAAIEAFKGLENVDLFIFYPHGRVSDIQRLQMTTPSESNVHAVAIDGDFDDAQARVKEMFNDRAFRDEVNLAGVNSINWARVLAQVVYYFSSAVCLGAPYRLVNFTVPTGNFGDIYAGSVARRMGLSIDRLVIATNQNDILHRALTTGRYQPDGVKPSSSPSMDIQVSSNFERALFDACQRDGEQVSALMSGLSCGGFVIEPTALARLRGVFASGVALEEQVRQTILDVYRNTGQIICPHSAVGVKVAEEYIQCSQSARVPMITLATAHPAKFPDVVSKVTNVLPALPAHMADLSKRAERINRQPNDLAALQAFIRERIKT